MAECGQMEELLNELSKTEAGSRARSLVIRDIGTILLSGTGKEREKATEAIVALSRSGPDSDRDLAAKILYDCEEEGDAPAKAIQAHTDYLIERAHKSKHVRVNHGARTAEVSG